MVLLLRGFAMGIMMMPVMTVAMDTIPPHQISRASALSNVLRQLFGAFSTAVFASILIDRQHFHQAVLTTTVTPDNLAALSVLSSAKVAMLQQGMSDSRRQRGRIDGTLAPDKPRRGSQRGLMTASISRRS